MESQTFKAGTAPGSPDTYSEIKTLVLYCLDKFSVPVSFELLHESMRIYELVNYFALIDTLEQLVSSGHLECECGGDGACLYKITKLGADTARELYPSLPPSVREKAVKALETASKREKRLREIKIAEEELEKGYMLELSIPDSGGSIVSLKVFAPTEAEKNLIKKRFLNDPAYIYNGIMALLTGDREFLSGAFPEGEKLF